MYSPTPSLFSANEDFFSSTLSPALKGIPCPVQGGSPQGLDHRGKVDIPNG